MLDGMTNRSASPRATPPPAAEPLAAPREAGSARAARWGVLEWFMIAQTAMPALLYIPGTQPLRVLIRVLPFGLSLVGLALWLLSERSPEEPRHPARPWLASSAIVVGVMVLHPTTNSPIAGLAQTALYLSVMAPVFWVPRLVSSAEQLDRILAIVLVSCGINAIVGVLQVYDPDRWLPQEFSRLVLDSSQGVLTYVGPSGEPIVRPPGLSDDPGSVCGPGMIAAFLGLFYFTRPIGWLRRLLALGCSFAGITAVYLSHVRTSLLLAAGMCAAYCVVAILQQRRAHAMAFAGASVAIISGAFVAALMLGGSTIADRFGTLYADDPTSVYYEAGRGQQLEEGFTKLLVDHPFGAGLGRWGMMRTYFGDPDNPASPLIWAELQIPAWILDGGILLLTLYGVALVRAAVHELALVRSTNPAVAPIAAVVFAINAGTLVLVFGFTPFTTQVGLQYWVLAGALTGLARTSEGSTCAPTS
jgi:hypothetical protein